MDTRIELADAEDIFLQAAIQIGAYMLEKFYPSHVIGRLAMTEEEFWEEKVTIQNLISTRNFNKFS